MSQFKINHLFIAIALCAVSLLPVAAQAHGKRNDATKVTDSTVLPAKKVAHTTKKTGHKALHGTKKTSHKVLHGTKKTAESAEHRVGHVGKQIFR